MGWGISSRMEEQQVQGPCGMSMTNMFKEEEGPCVWSRTTKGKNRRIWPERAQNPVMFPTGTSLGTQRPILGVCLVGTLDFGIFGNSLSVPTLHP